MPKARKFSFDRHVAFSAEQDDFLKTQIGEGNVNDFLRSMVDARMKNFDKEEAQIRKELAELKPRCVSLEKRLAEIETDKKRVEDERRTKEKLIEDAHQKLLVELKQVHNRVEDVPRPIIKFWSDKCGESVDDLKAFLKEQALIRK